MAAPYTGLIEINASIGKNNRPERCAGSSSSSFSGTTSDDNSIVLTITLACLS